MRISAAGDLHAIGFWQGTDGSVVDACDEIFALQHLDFDAAQPDVVAGITRMQHLVPWLDPFTSAPTAVTMPVRQAVVDAADAGRIRPDRVSVSSFTG